MNACELIPGDMLVRPKDPVWHLGIYLGNGAVLHNAPGLNGGETIASFVDFAKGQVVYVQQPSFENRAEILRRASQIFANPQPYSYLLRNCEHTFYEIVEGKPRSPTVMTLIALAAIAGAAVLAIKYRKEITRAVRELGH